MNRTLQFKAPSTPQYPLHSSGSESKNLSNCPQLCRLSTRRQDNPGIHALPSQHAGCCFCET